MHLSKALKNQKYMEFQTRNSKLQLKKLIEPEIFEIFQLKVVTEFEFAQFSKMVHVCFRAPTEHRSPLEEDTIPL